MFLVVAMLAVGGVLAVRLVAGTEPGPSTPGEIEGIAASPDTPDLIVIPGEPTGPTGLTSATGATGPVACRRASTPAVLEPSVGGEGAAAAAMTADYRFQHSPASSVGDAPDLVPTGDGSLLFVDDAESGQVVLSFSGGSGMSLAPIDGVIDDDRYTIELVFLFRELAGYAKIIDFRTGSDDSGLYSFEGCLHLYNYPVPSTPTRALRADSYVHVVLTRTAFGRVVGYVNGVRQFALRDFDEIAVIDNDEDALRFFLDDRFTQSEFADGAVARIRLYDRPLTAGEVAALACGELREILALEACGRGHA